MAIWPDEARMIAFAAVLGVLLAVLCAVTWWRYTGVRRATLPAEVMTAVEIGWVLCAVRVGLSIGLWALLRA